MVNATFEIESWDEQPYAKLENGGKLTKASVTQALSGEVEGEGSVEWLMCYRDDGTADFVGLQRIVGRLGDRTGSFVVLQAAGTFDGTAARAELAVVPGSGTGELSGLAGTGRFEAPHGGTPSMTLDVRFE
jgi:hypothetical protein